MRKLMLLAGVAALGVSMPALAKENGRGSGHGRGHAAQSQGQGHGQARNHGRGHGRHAQADRGRGGERGQNRLSRQERRVERAIQQERRIVRQARRNESRVHRNGRDNDRRFERRARADRRDWRGWTERRMAFGNRFNDDFVRLRADRAHRLAIGPAGCPPGLARQNAFCMPPGQLRKAQLIGQRLSFANLGYNIPERYRYRFADDDRFFYRYGNDWTVYRFDRGTGLVSSVIPLIATGLLLGEPLPLGYDVYNVPLGYRQFYPDSDDYLYRYADNAIYRVDSESMLVDGIVALLTGGAGGLGGLGIGDRLPAGYDVYNVPFDYRDTYYDTDEWMYRYADGSVYRVDPETQLIQAVISLLV